MRVIRQYALSVLTVLAIFAIAGCEKTIHEAARRDRAPQAVASAENTTHAAQR